MTSLELFPAGNRSCEIPKEWGTGKLKSETNIWVPRAPTWLLSGKPIEQYYSLTPLRLSNVRINDQLVPNPQEAPVGEVLFNRPFPAEHPYTSHMSRFALFPKFDSPEDPKRGVVARSLQPINDQMPATAYDVVIKQKTKGFGERHELQDLPLESGKKGLLWVGEHGFDQPVKYLGDRKQYYPVPPKTMAPNLQDREGTHLQVSQRSANVVRNIEREQWESTQQQQYTGLGPSNPKQLDNLAEKAYVKASLGIDDDTLYPRTINTFDPPRPKAGRVRGRIIETPPPLHIPQSSTPANPDYVRKTFENEGKKTLTEVEEDRLLHGKEYVNVPKPGSKPLDDRRWEDLDKAARPEANLENIRREIKGDPDAVTAPVLPVPRGGLHPIKDEATGVLKDEFDRNIQQIEAQNRFNLLESQTPRHDIDLLNIKKGHAVPKELPDTFYRHEGRYNEERAGLYKTSYDPYRLQFAMNPWAYSPQEQIVMRSLNSHVDALTGVPKTRLSEEMKDVFRYSRTLADGRNPGLSGDRRNTAELWQSYDSLRDRQREEVQPTSDTARVSVQEKEGPYRETVTGVDYNTYKFLQENELPKHARNEPNQLMSTLSKNIETVRPTTTARVPKAVQFKDMVTVAQLTPLQRLELGKEPLNALTDEEKEEAMRAFYASDGVCTTQYLSTHGEYKKENEGGKKVSFSDGKPGFQGPPPAMFQSAGDQGIPVTIQSGLVVPAGHSKPQPATAAPASAFPSVKTVARKHVPLMFHPEPGPPLEKSTVVPTEFDPPKRLTMRPVTCEGSEYRDNFNNLTVHLQPTEWHYKQLGPTTNHGTQYPYYDIGYKDDARYYWQASSGQPRPQTVLLKLQNCFSKTDARRRFHATFPETNPDLRDNNNYGKKHSFDGINSQVLHG